MPKNNKDIEINGRNFRLKKLDARTGSFMLFKIMKILPSILENINLDKLDPENLSINNLKDLNLTQMLNPIFELPEEEFRYIQDNCLKVIYEILPAGLQSVLNKNNEWGVLDIENDTGLVMNLTIQSLAFNLMGFFAGSPLTSIIEGVNLSKLNTKI
ncbi:hypothetical protein FC831_14485 [Clostridium botulinum]|nr:hypothetical protein ACP50_05295 [Clostridium botulinum]MBY6987858.1 hypothetical protein [Clostridium botulinum]NFH01460.1 hypothetical protein [Clostridium botulinum]NFP40917.1 hypothetical protein [Clostridium botulinum]NFQ57312.1 hypothetical protein [Clostridium botulinum]